MTGDEMVGWHHRLWEMKDREAWHAAVRGGRRVRHDRVTEQHPHLAFREERFPRQWTLFTDLGPRVFQRMTSCRLPHRSSLTGHGH